MAGWKIGGVDVYIGVTGSGKTTLAQAHRRKAADLYRLPCVTLDLEDASDWTGVPHALSAEEVLLTYCKARKSPRPWTPANQRERDKFFSAVAHWGGVAILVDGVPQMPEAHDIESEFCKALLKWRHGKLGPTFWFITAQRFALTPRTLYSAARYVRVFKQAPGRDAKRALEEFNIPMGDPKKPNSGSTAFARGQHVEILLGFDDGEERRGGPLPDPGKPAP
jgi:hypothetical protein